MPRYFFNVYDHRTILDDVGSELPDIEAVRLEAIRSSTELLHKLDGVHLWSGNEWKMVVVDEQGVEALTLRFTATIPSSA